MLPKIILDTSGINTLEDGGPSSTPMMRGLSCGFEAILSGTSIGELIATKRSDRREALLQRCDWLLQSATCIWEPNEIVRRQIKAHLSDASRFDWKAVDVRARAYETALVRRDFTEAVCIEQRRQHFEVEKEFKNYWKQLRPALDKILAEDPSKRPHDFKEAVAIAVRDGGVLWGLGQRLYKYVSDKEPTEAEIKAFMQACPPFRAACYGLVMGWYNWSLRDLADDTATAGRNDLMAAAYLPYCGRFISDDWAQRKDIRDVASEAELECEILSLAEFEASFVLEA